MRVANPNHRRLSPAVADPATIPNASRNMGCRCSRAGNARQVNSHRNSPPMNTASVTFALLCK